MIFCKELNTSYDNKLEMFLALKANASDIIRMKCGQEYKSHSKGQLSPFELDNRIDVATKSGFAMDSDYFYPIANTTLYMDSHSDVHDNGLWDKSLKENKAGYYYLDNHQFGLKNTIAYPKDVQVFTKLVDWAFLGKPYEGKTQALVGKIQKSSIRLEEAKYIVENKIPIQNSVRMIYIKAQFACKSDHKDLQEENKIYMSKIDDIANKDKVEEQGYFYLIKEARLFQEFSMVAFGSNDATPIMQKEDDTETEIKEAELITSTIIEPLKDTQKQLTTFSMMQTISKIKN